MASMASGILATRSIVGPRGVTNPTLSARPFVPIKNARGSGNSSSSESNTRPTQTADDCDGIVRTPIRVRPCGQSTGFESHTHVECARAQRQRFQRPRPDLCAAFSAHALVVRRGFRRRRLLRAVRRVVRRVECCSNQPFSRPLMTSDGLNHQDAVGRRMTSLTMASRCLRVVVRLPSGDTHSRPREQPPGASSHLRMLLLSMFIYDCAGRLSSAFPRVAHSVRCCSCYENVLAGEEGCSSMLATTANLTRKVEWSAQSRTCDQRPTRQGKRRQRRREFRAMRLKHSRGAARRQASEPLGFNAPD